MSMDLLIDTHVLLWWEQDGSPLRDDVRDLLADPDNRVCVSAITPWEIATKIRKGKLEFIGSPSAFIEANGFVPLAVTTQHGEMAGRLAWDHADPADRIIVAQAISERLTLVHADASIRGYPVAQLWAR